ncbi:MAG: hypothetical protein IJX53_06425 [Clostridia bacterium]|nr:hypothetical protein [Clostridia bacterium]
MKCPFCGRDMRPGCLETYRSAPTWKAADSKQMFTFGHEHLLTNRTPNVWHCVECDALLIEKAINKHIHRDKP